MPMYRVELIAKVTEYAILTLEAETPAQAEQLALQRARAAEWEYVDTEETTVYDIAEVVP